MKLSSVLASVKGPGEVKTAGAPAPAGTEKSAAASESGERLKQALQAVESGLAQKAEKTAATTPSPVEDLAKMAEQTVSLEREALLKEAKFYGEAVADSFMARLSQYNEAAVKLAAASSPPAPAAPAAAPSADSFEKFATENPQLVKEAAELGYERTNDQLEKLGQAAFRKGYEEATVAVYKTANACFVSGYEDGARLLEGVRK